MIFGLDYFLYFFIYGLGPDKCVLDINYKRQNIQASYVLDINYRRQSIQASYVLDINYRRQNI